MLAFGHGHLGLTLAPRTARMCGNLSACLLCRWVGHFLALNVNQHLLSASSLAIRFAAVAALADMRSADGLFSGPRRRPRGSCRSR